MAGTGRAQQIHDALIQSVEVDFVTLLVDSTHPRVQALYEKWGYEKRDETRHFDDSPLYAVMVRTLRASEQRALPLSEESDRALCSGAAAIYRSKYSSNSCGCGRSWIGAISWVRL